MSNFAIKITHFSNLAPEQIIGSRKLPDISLKTMIFSLPENPEIWPQVHQAEPDGLLAVGGDLSPLRLVYAYANGIFPWFNADEPYLWWSLDPRMVLTPSNFLYHKSLRRVVESGRFEVRRDTCFEEVMLNCAQVERKGQHGSWITNEMIDAYVRLHQLGLAHSFETFCEGRLVGGLYGVSVGDWFSGESMFHHSRDASKVAFIGLLNYCTIHGFRFIDAQQETPHLSSLGATPIPRRQFIEMLQMTDWENAIIQRCWTDNSVVLLIGGNQGDRLGLIQSAHKAISERIGPITRQSPIYETEPWGFEAEQNFLNQALVVETPLDAESTLLTALDIEKALGRERDEKTTAEEKRTYTSRPIDIDLIFFNTECRDTQTLSLPHPRLHLRRFVLQPLCDLMPDFVHPRLRMSISTLLDKCPDKSEVKIYEL